MNYQRKSNICPFSNSWYLAKLWETSSLVFVCFSALWEKQEKLKESGRMHRSLATCQFSMYKLFFSLQFYLKRIRRSVFFCYFAAITVSIFLKLFCLFIKQNSYIQILQSCFKQLGGVKKKMYIISSKPKNGEWKT